MTSKNLEKEILGNFFERRKFRYQAVRKVPGEAVTSFLVSMLCNYLLLRIVN